jgi:hypothetical protein
MGAELSLATNLFNKKALATILRFTKQSQCQTETQPAGSKPVVLKEVAFFSEGELLKRCGLGENSSAWGGRNFP